MLQRIGDISTDCHRASNVQKKEIEYSFVILDKVYKNETEAELENLMHTKLAVMYSNLEEKCKAELFEFKNCASSNIILHSVCTTL